ncbi:MAG: SPFH/Band 7/PHB domain protein [Planctomycetes bacterium]|jgi:regulator of protease activity HflC (stomatin/prohibitin superfamily)|nr:SPFH/Band 7/PHB domain protein [Planctomycetota bacterium]MBT4028795.1 SPFH/Band 7/PHB domain protein [Planctomycetota bacterium]MBT4559645.1 SPFH/Band 7/PHB domain protein [Planctomycetota bacterium]MBT5100677.1 SPFH/Band 7/PHB domain protein [Planctomycetota bacterium]MBT5119785.1 SPFH/Band 7/PHB domain protein [Planctomycetota bacterium]
MPGLIIILSFVVFIIVMGAMGLRTVKQAEVIIIERLGKYHRTLSPGINIIWPIIDKARPISWRTMSRNRDGSSILIHTMSRSIDLREQVFDFPSQQVITADNVMIEINGLLYYQITDPQAAVYEIANLPNAIEKLAQTTLRNIIGDLALDMTLTSRDEINKKMREVLDEATDKWGVKVNRVEVQDIEPPESVREAMEKQMKAERERRAAILEAEGVKASKVLRAEGERDSQIAVAEGDRQAAVLRADGEAAALERVEGALAAQGTSSAQYQVALSYLATLEKLASQGRGDKTVFLPYESANVLGSLGSIKELLGEVGGSAGVGKPPQMPGL